MKKEASLIILTIVTLGIAAISTLFLSSIGLAATNTSTINVNVSSVGQISVTPTVLEWVQISPGDNGTDKTLTITNTGSVTFSTGVYASVNSFSEPSNPLLAGTSTAFQAGDYLVLKNSSDTNYHFVNRMEWNDTDGVIASITNRNANGVAWGRYRNKTNFWVWELIDDAGNNCSTAATLSIQSTVNSYNLASATTATGVANGTLYDWTTFTINSGPLSGYCIAAKWSCKALMIYRWDKNSSLPTCTNAGYLNSSLSPGASLSVTANVFVPSGTPADNATSSTLTITAT